MTREVWRLARCIVDRCSSISVSERAPSRAATRRDSGPVLEHSRSARAARARRTLPRTTAMARSLAAIAAAHVASCASAWL